MDNLNIALDLSKLFYSLLGGLIVLIGILVSLIWKNFNEQISTVKNMSQVLGNKLDRNLQDIIKNSESNKLQLAEHEILIHSMQQNNIHIERQLQKIYDDIDELPIRILNLLKSKS